jgi:uncharacterized protein YprB with RNaseH-like and TPR domain
MTNEEKIEAGLKLFLREEHGIEATSAYLDESEVERGTFAGIETFGSERALDTITTSLIYEVEGRAVSQSIEIKGTSLDFLPKLLGYINRAVQS